MYLRYKILIGLAFLTYISFGQNALTIGIVGDQFGSYDAVESYQIMEKAVEKITAYNPDVILHVGDMVESIRGIETFDDYHANFERATDILNKTNIPWIVSIGDHGVVPPVFKTNSDDRSREEWFLTCANEFKTPIKDKPYYSIDIKGYHFIALYSLENLHTDPRWGSIFQNKISEKQFEWLKQDLEKNKNSKGIIVVVHHPMWYVWSNWMEIHNLLTQYPVISVLAGHYHYDQDDGILDGIKYSVMGSTGGVVKVIDVDSGGIQEYGILHIKNQKIESMNLYEVNSDSLLEWTPRISMDRIQAISCVLDNLFGEIKLVKENDRIYVLNNNGDTSEYINISSIANPIDLPIEIQISSQDCSIADQSWTIDDSTFLDTDYVKLEPGYNIDWANYSNVGQWYEHPTIWKARLNQDNISENITLSFAIKFIDTKERTIKRDISYFVR